jgi:hypothetical protein
MIKLKLLCWFFILKIFFVIFTPSEQMARPSISADEIQILEIKTEKVKRNY